MQTLPTGQHASPASTSAGSMVTGETAETPVDEPTAAVDADQLDTLPPTSSTGTGSTGTASAEPLAATPLGSRYVLDSMIGSGATGRVFRGRRRSDDAPVAVKVLREEFTRDADTMVRFLRQRSVLRALDHPDLVRVHDLVAEGEVLAVVMDLVDGDDLRRLPERQALDTAQMLTLLGQVAEALAAVHGAGVVHRDIKPENVLVQWREGQPHALLTDFGLAGAATGPSDLTKVSQLLGTPAYVAPELVTGQPAVPATDVYGLGVMAYELLAGERPFTAPNTAALLRAHLEIDPARPPNMAEPIWDLLRVMLAKEPTARPTAAEVATALTTLRQAGQLPPTTPRQTPPSQLGGAAPSHPQPDAAADPDPSLASRLGDAALSLTGAGTGTGHDATQPTSGATRPAPAAAPPTPPRRRHGPLVLVIVTVSLLGVGAGLWFGRPLLSDTPQHSQALPISDTPQPSETPRTPPTSGAPQPSETPRTPTTSDAPQPSENTPQPSQTIDPPSNNGDVNGSGLRDVTGDGKSDLLAIHDSNHHMYRYTGSGTGRLAGTQLGPALSTTRLITLADFTGDGHADMLAIRTDEDLYHYRGTGNGNFQPAVRIGNGGWGAYRLITSADFTGDGRADLLAVHSNGDLYRYNGNANGTVSRIGVVGSGWDSMRLITSADFTGDGRADLLAVHSNGDLYRYNGNADGTVQPGVRIWDGGWGWFRTITAADYTSDGHADLLAVHSNGDLYRYDGNPDGTVSRIGKIGDGWTDMRIINT